jgi:sulfur-carrier protein
MSNNITITLKLFAAYQEVFGVEELRLECSPGTTVGEIGDRCIHEYPQLGNLRDVTRFGVNLEFVPRETVLNDGDEVVLIPPVSGG